jgi:RNA polymerase sigma factor (sigma-70 family)
MSSTTSQHGAGTRSPGGETPLWDTAARDFAAWRAGDASALEHLVRLLTPVLWHLARSYGLDREAAEDVVQTTWLALVRRADTLRDPQAVWRWATVTARREAWRISRAGNRETAAETGTLESAAPPVPGPEGVVLADSCARALWRQVARLTERCRRLLRVIAFDERPDYAALSAELGMPVGSIGPTRGRCLEKLRGLLADDPEWR